ncbi:hypothetical protein DFH11DRAFT_1600112, partial [Phellopilus nigrolimitatus]
ARHYALFCFVLGIGTFNSLVEDVAVYLDSRETEETAEVFEFEISDCGNGRRRRVHVRESGPEGGGDGIVDWL